MARTRPTCAPAIVALTFLVGAVPCAGQDLEPKAYSASPIGATFVVVGFGRATGGVVFDPTLPVTDVNAKVNSGLLAGGYSFGLGGKLVLATAAIPYAWGDLTGQVGGDARATSRSGLGDARLKFSVNFIGNPAMRARAFAKAPRKTIVGASLTAVTPTGQHYPEKLINLGTNRWGFKPEIGVAAPFGRWDVDAYLGVWLFSQNDDFYPGGVSRSQDPVLALQSHVSYTFKPRLWAAVDATWYRGGSSTVEGGTPSSSMNNARLGATVSLPLGPTQSIKVAYSGGIVVRTGTNFRSLSIGFQKLWLTKK